MKQNQDVIALRNMVCNVNGVKIAEFRGRGRKRELFEVRMMFSALAKEFFNLSQQETGTYQNRDHSTILHQLKEHGILLPQNPAYRKQFFEIREEFKEYIGVGVGSMDPLVQVSFEILKSELAKFQDMLAA